MIIFSQTLVVVGVAIVGYLPNVESRTSLPARPSPHFGTRAGFLLKDPAGTSTQPQEPSSFSRLRVFSAGLRSSCARERASMRRNKDWTGASAATRLRGGSWGSTPFVPQVLADADKPPETPTAFNKLDSCTNRQQQHHNLNHQDSQYVVAKQRVLDDVDPDDTFTDQGGNGRGGIGGDAGGGGGGGERAGALPSLPRTLPAGKAALNKKFAWVP